VRRGTLRWDCCCFCSDEPSTSEEEDDFVDLDSELLPSRDADADADAEGEAEAEAVVTPDPEPEPEPDPEERVDRSKGYFGKFRKSDWSSERAQLISPNEADAEDAESVSRHR